MHMYYLLSRMRSPRIDFLVQHNKLMCYYGCAQYLIERKACLKVTKSMYISQITRIIIHKQVVTLHVIFFIRIVGGRQILDNGQMENFGKTQLMGVRFWPGRSRPLIVVFMDYWQCVVKIVFCLLLPFPHDLKSHNTTIVICHLTTEIYYRKATEVARLS